MVTKDHNMKSGSIAAYKQYTMKGLPTSGGYTRVAQKTHIVPPYAYVIQLFSGASIAKVSKGVISGSTIDFSSFEPMTLNGFGHTQTLEPYTWGDTDYFWVGTKGEQTQNDSANHYNTDLWATQLGRFKFEAGKTLEVTDIDRLTYLTRINPSGNSEGAIGRVEAALSSNTQYLLVMTVNKDRSKARLTIYDNGALNTALDSSSTVSMADMTSHIVKTWPVSGNIYTKLLNGSIQGIDLSNKFKTSNNWYIYISGGNLKETPSITKVTFGDTAALSKGKYADNIYFPINFRTESVETESVQIFDADNLYLGIAYHDSAHTIGNYIYRTAKNSY